MGSCVSFHTKTQTSSNVQMSSIPPTPIKDTKPDPTPLPVSRSSNSRVSPFISLSSYRSHGSREEAFYDTQGWLESDCEDDFYSVNGDFTPSRGNTPVHPSIGTPRVHKTFSPQVNKALFDVRQPLSSGSLCSRGSASVRRSFSAINGINGTSLSEDVNGTSPQETTLKPKSKKLADLFRESMRERGGVGFSFPGYESDTSQRTGTSPNNPNLPPKPPRAESSPLSSSHNVPHNAVLEKNKSSKFSQRCFPKLVHIRKH